MLKTRIILATTCALVVYLLFLLPKSVIENDNELTAEESVKSIPDQHTTIDAALKKSISNLRLRIPVDIKNQNNAIFADSLARLYSAASMFDSAAWYFEKAAAFFDSPESLLKAGDAYYQAFSFSLDESKRRGMAEKAQSLYGALLEKNPDDLNIMAKLAMTYMGTATPMRGISLLREILAKNPNHEQGLLNMGLLSVQSGQYPKAIEWLKKLIEVNPLNAQGQMLLGVAYAGNGDKQKALEQFERTKKMNLDPAVEQQLDAYIKDLK